MPIYKYQCYDCGLQFEALVSFALREQPKDCMCGAKAKPLMPESVSFSFDQQPKDILPQNTGVTSFDAKVDRVIGAHARKGWTVIGGRHQEKKKILRANPQIRGTDLAPNEDGSYRVVPSQERLVSRAVKTLHSEALSRIAAHQAKQKASDQ